MWFHPKLLLPTLRCSKFLSFFLSAIYIEPFFQEPPPPLQVLPSFPLPAWEITKSHWCLHFMEEMWDSETLMVWLRAETRNQNSYWGNQGSMFCCVIRSQRCILPRGMCLTCLRGQKLGAKIIVNEARGEELFFRNHASSSESRTLSSSRDHHKQATLNEDINLRFLTQETVAPSTWFLFLPRRVYSYPKASNNV